MLRGLLRIGLVIAIALVVGVPGCVVWHSRDLPEALDGDLDIPPLEIEDEESNAYTHLERAAAALAWPEELEASPRLGDDWDPQRVERLVASNQAALAHLQRALEAPSLDVPRYEFFRDNEALSSLLLSNLKLTHVLAARAFLCAERGETRSALEDGLTVVRFGHRLQRAHQGELIHMMSGVALKGHGLRIIREVAAHAPIDADLAREFERRLHGYRTAPETWGRIWASEYQARKQMWEAVRADPLGQQLDGDLAAYLPEGERHSALRSLVPEAYVYHHNRSLTLDAEFMRSMQRDSFKPCAELEPPMEFVPRDQNGMLRMVVSPNSVGRILLAISTPDLRRFQFRRCGSDTILAATRAVLALEAYRDERGALPGSLEELVPEFLSEVPRDAFDGNPLRYLPERAVVYSVGADFIDEDGRVEADERDLDEPAFRVGAPAQKLHEEAS
jgi:hypothetical protein